MSVFDNNPAHFPVYRRQSCKFMYSKNGSAIQPISPYKGGKGVNLCTPKSGSAIQQISPYNGDKGVNLCTPKTEAQSSPFPRIKQAKVGPIHVCTQKAIL